MKDRALVRRYASLAAIAVALACAAAGGAPLLQEGLSAEAVRLAGVLGIQAGSTVAEVGAGQGEITIEMARVVGEKGRVYSTELGEDKLAALRDAVKRSGAGAVTVLEAAEAETRLPAACCDAVFMRRVYHHLTHPDQIDASLLAALRPGGHLAVIDFEPRGDSAPTGVPANRTGHGVTPAIVVEELTRAGFEHLRTDDWVGGMYLALFRKPVGAHAPTRDPHPAD